MRLFLATAVAIATMTACATSPTPDDDLCADAQAHLTACFGVAPAATTCAPEAAAEVLAQDCAVLTEPGKADLFSSALCRLGVLSQCAVKACEVSASADTCADYLDREDCAQCDYYLCRDAAAPASCGATGYYRGFGYAYCERYLEVTTPRLSPAGQAFAHDVRRCLMQAMEDTIPTDTACPDVKTAAYASHPDCYVAAGFCALPLTDWLAILATIRPTDTSFREIVKTAMACL